MLFKIIYRGGSSEYVSTDFETANIYAAQKCGGSGYKVERQYKRLQWHETWDYRAHQRYWWTERDDTGTCFEVRSVSGSKYRLVINDISDSTKYDTLHDAMRAAERIWNQNVNDSANTATA